MNMDAAFRIMTRVLPGHRIEFAAPELPEGQEVAVSVALPDTQELAGVESLFRMLAVRWQNETVAHSSVSQIAMHPAYQGIIGLGRPAVPLILRELQQRPNHWFWALRAITGEDPIKPDQRGKIREMTSAWLQWGNERGYIP
jgi:hypothetical protein